jgi:GT2 family glycosyltransferase
MSRGTLPVRYLYVAEPGKSAAVNTALTAAKGDVLAFVDDDVCPESDWLDRLIAAFRETGADFVAGRIVPTWEAMPPPWISPAVYGVLAVPDNGPLRRPIVSEADGIMPIGANMAVRSSVVVRIGGLHPDLGKLGASFRTGEDHEFFLRMLRAGYRGVYEPTAVVHHWVPRSRLVRGYFRRWMYQNGRDVAQVDAAYSTAIRLLRVPRYLWRSAAADLVEAVAATIGRNPKRRFAAIGRLVWFTGYLGESWRRRTAAAAAVARPAEG